MTSGDEGQDYEGQGVDGDALAAEAERLVADALPRVRWYFRPELEVLGHGLFGSPDRAADEVAEGVQIEWEAKWED
jgi:hypothetical protein